MLRSINEKQSLILKEIDNTEKMVVTNLIDKLSKKHNISESTLRWNIKQLRKYGLIDCGTKGGKGRPIILTDNGILVKKIIGGNKDE